MSNTYLSLLKVWLLSFVVTKTKYRMCMDLNWPQRRVSYLHYSHMSGDLRQRTMKVIRGQGFPPHCLMLICSDPTSYTQNNHLIQIIKQWQTVNVHQESHNTKWRVRWQYFSPPFFPRLFSLKYCTVSIYSIWIHWTTFDEHQKSICTLWDLKQHWECLRWFGSQRG